MRFKVSEQSRAPRLALTSMLDVIFLLLCFFVTISVYSQWENEISVTLPSAKTADEPERLAGEVVVNILADGKIRVNGASLESADLAARLKRLVEFYPGQSVIIRADRNARYDCVVKVLDVCRGAGVWNFSFATDTEKK